MTKQELYKILKEKKLFSVYCVVIANAFWEDENPRGYKDGYIKQSLHSINQDIQTIENYLHSVSTWTSNHLCKFDIKIQP